MLRTNKRTAKLTSFACKYARELMGKFLVHAKHIANLTATNTYVTSRHVYVWTNMASELKHESLAETHHFSI